MVIEKPSVEIDEIKWAKLRNRYVSPIKDILYYEAESASDGLVYVKDYIIHFHQIPRELDYGNVKVSIVPIFCTQKLVPPGTYEIELSKDDILQIFRELDVPEWIYISEKKGDEMLVFDILSLAASKKIVDSLKDLNNIAEIVRIKAKELGDFIKERARSKLEEVS